MAEMRGKGWRVLGYFLWMLGAGVVLDAPAIGVGGAMLGIGAAIFLLGVAQSLQGRSAA